MRAQILINNPLVNWDKLNYIKFLVITEVHVHKRERDAHGSSIHVQVRK